MENSIPWSKPDLSYSNIWSCPTFKALRGISVLLPSGEVVGKTTGVETISREQLLHKWSLPPPPPPSHPLTRLFVGHPTLFFCSTLCLLFLLLCATSEIQEIQWSQLPKNVRTSLWGRANVNQINKKEGEMKPGWGDSSGRYPPGVAWSLPSECSHSELCPQSFLVPRRCWALPRRLRDQRVSIGLHSATLNCPATARPPGLESDQFYHTGLSSVWLITWKSGRLYQRYQVQVRRHYRGIFFMYLNLNYETIRSPLGCLGKACKLVTFWLNSVANASVPPNDRLADRKMQACSPPTPPQSTGKH